MLHLSKQPPSGGFFMGKINAKHPTRIADRDNKT